jgi:hypothetical protein
VVYIILFEETGDHRRYMMKKLVRLCESFSAGQRQDPV